MPRLERHATLIGMTIVMRPQLAVIPQMGDVIAGVINWVNADLVTHIVPRV